MADASSAAFSAFQSDLLQKHLTGNNCRLNLACLSLLEGQSENKIVCSEEITTAERARLRKTFF